MAPTPMFEACNRLRGVNVNRLAGTLLLGLGIPRSVFISSVAPDTKLAARSSHGRCGDAARTAPCSRSAGAIARRLPNTAPVPLAGDWAEHRAHRHLGLRADGPVLRLPEPLREVGEPVGHLRRGGASSSTSTRTHLTHPVAVECRAAVVLPRHSSRTTPAWLWCPTASS